MRLKIKHIIFVMIIVVSASVIALCCESFQGVPFEYDLIAIIFSIITFSCISAACKMDSRCLFCNEYRAVRYNKRKKNVLVELRKRILSIIILVIIYNCIIAIIQNTSITETCKLITLEMIVYMFLLIIQFYLEIKFGSDIGYLTTVVIYISLLFAGIMMYRYCTNYNNSISEVLNMVNKINVINYSSLNRIYLLECNEKTVISAFIIIDGASMVILPFTLRKTDIIERN